MHWFKGLDEKENSNNKNQINDEDTNVFIMQK